MGAAFAVGGIQVELAGLYRAVGNGEKALKFAYEGVENRENLLASNSKDLNAKSHLAQSYIQIGRSEVEFGDWGLGHAALEKSIALHREVLQNSSSHDQSANSIIFAYVRLAQAYQQDSRYPQTCETLIAADAAMQNAREQKLLREFAENRTTNSIKEILDNAAPCMAIPSLQKYIQSTQ